MKAPKSASIRWLSRHSAKIVPKIEVSLLIKQSPKQSSAMSTMEVMSSSSSMDNSFSSSHEAEGKNVATYYFRHESGDSECETSSDEGMGRSTAALNYSREDIQALATQAELMVLGRIESRREMEATVDGDSDYSSNHPLSPLVSSEPNLQRRTSPKRRVLNSRRRDWRNSLPECLEFYHDGGQHNRGSAQRSLQHSVSTGGERAASSSPQKHLQPSSDSQISDSEDGSVAAQERLSAPELSELWEEEQCQSEDLAWSDEGGEQDLPGLLSFGEDYGRFLKRLGDTASSSDGEESLPGRRCRRRKSLKNQRKEKKTEEVNEQKGERLWNVRGKLQEMARGLHELGDDLDQARAEDRLSLVCELKQEVGLVAQSLEEAHAQLLSPAFDAGEKEKGRRWLSWGITSSLILLSLVSLGSAIVSCLQPHCCSDPSNSWAILSNPVTFSYVNGPPPI